MSTVPHYPQLCRTLWTKLFKSPKTPLSTQFYTVCIIFTNDFTISVDNVDKTVDNPIYGVKNICKSIFCAVDCITYPHSCGIKRWILFCCAPTVLHNIHRHAISAPVRSTHHRDVQSEPHCSSVSAPSPLPRSMGAGQTPPSQRRARSRRQ